MSEFKQANLPVLIEAGVPPKLAQQALDILDKQNQGQLPCPLQGEDLHIVQSAWQWMKAQGFFHR
jgi:hypothetical protein